MPAPTREEIRKRALEIYFMRFPEFIGRPTPEDDELRELNIWRQAQLELMTKWGVKLDTEIREAMKEPEKVTTEYLDYLSGELDAMRREIEKLKAEKPMLPMRPKPPRRPRLKTLPIYVVSPAVTIKSERELIEEGYVI